MKNIFIGFLIIFLLQSVCLSCESLSDRVYILSIRNESEHKIGFYAARPGVEHMYPDTQINSTSVARPVVANSAASTDSSVPWEEVLKELPSDTLSIFIFHWDTIENFTWQEIRDDYKVLKRYDLSIEDLRALDFKVPYPPTAEMSGMQMYPPE